MRIQTMKLSVLSMVLFLAVPLAALDLKKDFKEQNPLHTDGVRDKTPAHFTIEDEHGIFFPITVPEMSEIDFTVTVDKDADFRMCLATSANIAEAVKWLQEPIAENAPKAGFWSYILKKEANGVLNQTTMKIDKGDYKLLMYNAGKVKNIDVSLSYKIKGMTLIQKSGEVANSVSNSVEKTTESLAEKGKTVADQAKQKIDANPKVKRIVFIGVGLAGLILVFILIAKLGGKKSDDE